MALASAKKSNPKPATQPKRTPTRPTVSAKGKNTTTQTAKRK